MFREFIHNKWINPLSSKLYRSIFGMQNTQKKRELEMHKTHVQLAFMDGVKRWRIKC